METEEEDGFLCLIDVQESEPISKDKLQRLLDYELNTFNVKPTEYNLGRVNMILDVALSQNFIAVEEHETKMREVRRKRHGV